MKFIQLKEGTKQPYNRHCYYESLDELSDAAMALDNEKGVIFIDFDNLEDNKGKEERILKGISAEYPSSLIVNTTRGKHLYYKTERPLRQWTADFINIGMKCDAKIGNAYGIIKQNNCVREYTGELSFDNLTQLPDILLPMRIGKDIENLCGLKKGEGRHNKLLRHLCQVRKNYDDVDINSIANFINKYVFDDSLDEEELTNIINSSLKYDIDSVDDRKNTNKVIERIIFTCKSLVKKYDIHVSNEQLYFYENGKYIHDDKKLQKIIYKEYEYSKSEYDEILFQLKIIAPEEQGKNSVIKLRNGALVDGIFDPNNNDFSSSYLDIDYDEAAYNEEVDKFFQFITNNEESSKKNDLRIILEEMLGTCLMTKNFPHKIYLLLGSGANGKSTLVNVLFDMFGDLASSVPLDKLNREDYLARLTNKLLNISDDIDFDFIKSSQNIKTLASGDYVTARELYSKAYSFKNYATLIFTMNEIIVFSDHSYGLERRLCILPFENKVKNADPTILERLTTDKAKSYLLRLAIEGMNRIKANNWQLSESKTVESIVKNYIIENDSVYSFIEFSNSLMDNQTFSYVYDQYRDYCIQNQFNPVKKNKFSRKMKTKGYITTVKNIGSIPTRVIVREESNQ